MVNQSAVQDVYLNPEEEDMALTFENQNRNKIKKKSAVT